MSTRPIAVTLSIPPWFHDHCFAGRTVLAAVEAIHLLAGAAGTRYPGLEPLIMVDARFHRFLEIPRKAAEIDVLLDLQEEEEGRIRACLYTRQRLKAMTRTFRHCELSFLAPSANTTPTQRCPGKPSGGYHIEIPVDRLYRELVPFGPTYRTLQGRLLLTEEGAWGQVQAPSLLGPTRDDNPAGNPFPLDGAMHAACVHGQRLVNFVPFPVGFSWRMVHLPTCAGERYETRVRLQSRSEEELVYDIWLLDEAGTIREEVQGLRMSDVSGGRIRPPDWIRIR
jgi:hypothetical protein